LASANDLYELIKLVYKQSNQVILDETLCNRLQVSSWAAVFNDFGLLAANKENIEKWLTEIDGWMNTALYPLSMLAHDALEQLLSCEQQICRYSHEPQAPVAPSASRVPAQYLVLPLGKERNRLKLSCWDRFYNGDGAFLGVARMALASAIVAMVVFFGNRVGLEYTVTIYNGLSRAVTVKLPQFDVPIPAASSITLDTALGKNPVIETITQQQALIERFTPELHGHGQHYVYNVAAATPLLKATIGYGSAINEPYQVLGIPRWFASSADIFFAQPPDHVATQNGAATRKVLQAPGDLSSDHILALLNDAERKRVILVRAQWDLEQSAMWAELAKSIATDAVTKTIQAELQQDQTRPLPPSSAAKPGWKATLDKLKSGLINMRRSLVDAV
ncbi:MAG: hypothetical protein ABL925_04100, partial [Methylococcales bacterium]